MVSYQTLKKYFLRGMLVCAGLVVAAYIADYLMVRYQMTQGASRSPFGTVNVFLAVPTKNGQVQLFYQHPQSMACLRSLFPHLGYEPCWYAGRSGYRLI